MTAQTHMYKYYFSHTRVWKKGKGRILKRVNGLNANPFRYIKRLKVVPLFSLRVGIYRVSMSIERNNLVIVAIDVGKRENDYDDL